MSLTLYFVFGTLALLGLPLFVVMSGVALTAFTYADIDPSAVSLSIYQVASQPMLLSIPLFTLAGMLMAESQSPQRLLRLAKALFGHLPGGVAIVSLVVCAFFTAFTGASGVTIVALGGLLFPILTQQGYNEKFSLGLISTSGSLGLLFPPSLPIILYGLVARVDIEKLFRAGIVPGILLIAFLSAYSIWNGREFIKKQKKEAPPFSITELKDAFKGCFFELLLPIGILVGIYGGYTTAHEASAFTAFYVLLMEVVIYRDLKVKDLPNIMTQTLSLVGGILLILCCAVAFTDYLVDEQVPDKILDFIRQFVHNKYLFLMGLNIFLLIVGCMMDIFSAIVVVVPLIVPLAAEYGVDPVHLAIIFLTNLEIGFITPPVGMNLFISSFRFKKPVTVLYKSCLPFLFILLLALMIITYVPGIILY